MVGRRKRHTAHGERTTRRATPAITARPVAVRNGLNPPTASFVSGTENENITTPANAQARPSRRTEAGAAAAAVVVACIGQSVATGLPSAAGDRCAILHGSVGV